MNKEETYKATTKRWDDYFHKICVAVASKSPCLSRQIGAVIVRDNSVVSTGFNGPARGYRHCEGIEPHCLCPRHAAGFNSGEALDICPAGQAEVNAISNAARLGVSVKDCTLYMNCIIPYKDCAIQVVNSGIVEVVVDELEYYHDMSKKIFQSGNVKVRRFR